MLPAADAVECAPGALAVMGAPSQFPLLFYRGVICPAFEPVAVGTRWKISRLKRVVAVAGDALGLELGYFALILVGCFHDPSLQGFLAGGACFRFIDPIAHVGRI